MERQRLVGLGLGDLGRTILLRQCAGGERDQSLCGGKVHQCGRVAANCIAKWDGSAWSALGSGMNGYVSALAVSGTNLYAGGGFTTAGGVPANRIAKWDGSAWSALGSGMDGGGQLRWR